MKNLPSDAARLLRRASELIKYSVMENIDTTNENHTEALQLATCAQIEYWIEQGESTSMANNYKSLSIGSFSVDFGNSASHTLATRARQYLLDQGLLFRGVRTNAYPYGALDSDLSN